MAIQTVTDIVESIINQLRISDPSVSAEIGTPEREFIEAIAEIIASAQVDFSVLDSQHDVDTMTGNRLDSYLSLFGFQRQQGISATGTVTFFRNSVATDDIVIPVGTPVNATAADPTLPDVTFQTTQTVTLPTGALEVDAPAQAALPGTIGNVAASSVTGFGSTKTIIGIVGLRNDAAMAGGTDPEDDDGFRVRFKNTIFRNMAGTTDQFLALSVSQPNVSKAVVLGPISRYLEYIQVPAVDDVAAGGTADTNPGTEEKNYDSGGTGWPDKSTTAASSIPYSKYTYNTQFYLSNGSKFYRPDVDYVFNRKAINPASSPRAFWTAPVAAHQPNVTILNPTADLAPSSVILFEHAYISSHSRNDIPSGVLNAVDVFVNGDASKAVKSAEVMPTSANNLQNSNAEVWTYQHPTATKVINFRRFLSDDPAAVGSKILPLYWQPVLTIPPKVSIKHEGNGTTYILYGARYYDQGDDEYYYDNPDGSFTGGQIAAGYPRVANYIGVYESNGYQGTNRSRSGIEFRAGSDYNVRKIDESGDLESFDSTNSNFAGNQFVGSLAYTYDQNPGAIQAIMDKNKQVTTDVLVHRATNRYFHLNVTVMYSPGATQSVVNAGVQSAISGYFENQYFGATIQLSDLLQIIHNVPGIDNVRWTHDVTAGTHKVEEVKPGGGAIAADPAGGFAITGGKSVCDTDFYLQDNELAAVPSANIVTVEVRAQNTWGS